MLLEALDDAGRGQGSVQLLFGEPGIGKTHLAAALAEHAAARGAHVIWTRGWVRATPAYWPWVEVVRGLAHDLDGDTLRTQLGPAADQLLQLAPELGLRLPAAQPPARDGDDSEIARFALFDALVGLLRVRSSSSPVVIVMDDLQDVDESSLVALDLVSRMLHDVAVLLVLTMQEHALGRTSAMQTALQNIAHVGRRLVLGGLTRDDVGRLIELTSGMTSPPALATAVHTVTEGNPFFAHEILAVLLAEGRLHDPPDEMPLPDGVRETIRRRLDPLDARSVQMLELAAIIGCTFDLATLERASPLDRDSILAILDDAAKLGLVVSLPDRLGQYRFGHGLIRETLHAGIPATARMNGHRIVGEALEDAYRGAIDAHLPELAHHFLSAGLRGDLAKAVNYAERAAHRALNSRAYEQAAKLFTRALEVLERMGQDVARSAELLLGLGTAQSCAGLSVARRTLEAAVAAARSIQSGDIFARAVLGLAPIELTPGYVDKSLVGLLAEALDRIGGADDPTRVRLLGSLAVALYWSDNAKRRAEIATEALEMARRLGDDMTLAVALSSAQLATYGPDATEQGLKWLRELFTLTERTGETVMSIAARSRHVDVLLELGDAAGADIAIETLEHLVQESESRAAAYVSLHRARRAALDGSFDDAQWLLDQVVDTGERSGSTIPMTVGYQRLVMTWLQKGPREIGEPARAYALSTPAVPCWRAALAAALADAGRRDEAELEFDRLIADDFALLPRDGLWLTTMALLSEAIVALDLREHAMAVHAQLAPFAGRNVVLPTVAFLGAVEMWLGILARVAGRDAEAFEHLAAARTRATRDGAWPALARIAAEEAVLLVRDGGAAARARAEELIESARAECEQMGLIRVADQIDALRLPPHSQRFGPAAVAESPDPATDQATLRRIGDVWTVAYRDRTLHLSDGRGVRLLAMLLERPGTEVHSLDLVAAVDGATTIGRSADQETAGRFGVQAGTRPALDTKAKNEYRQRIEMLEAQIAKAQSPRDDGDADQARTELDLLRRELGRSIGTSGRDREPSSHAERARVNVTRAIRVTLKRIAGYDANLGLTLERDVKTGTFCGFRPSTESSPTWLVIH